MPDIKNEEIYLSRMRKTFSDKKWFMDVIPREVDTIIDFGSADNSFIDFLRNDHPEYRYVGIENNEDFLRASIRKGQECYRSITEFKENAEYGPSKTLLVLNSVLHEVYSYGYEDSFWHSLRVLKPKYIAIRDMNAMDCDRFSSGTLVEFERMIERHGIGQKYKDFIEKWGRALDGYTALHFMLKYFYDENWSREVAENYIPFTYRELYRKFREIGYDVSMSRFYLLPYLKRKWSADFLVDENGKIKEFINHAKTHMKIFLLHEDEDA
jgi:hypothetical protein